MRLSRLFLGLAVAVSAVLVAPFAIVSAATNYGSVQGYGAEAPLDNGTIVTLAGKDSNQVKIATKKEEHNMFGVTVDRNLLPFTLSQEGLANEVFVAHSGTYNVIVSTEGGPIAAGDYVALSSVNGVAKNAGTEKTTVFGRAASKFDGKGVTLGTTTLKDSNGKVTKTVTLGLIPVAIDIRHNPNDKSTKAKVPEFLQRVGQAVAEKEVSPIRIYLSMAIATVSLLMALSVLYSGVRSGVISIGRNPMSKKSIFRAIFEIILTSFLILIIGLFAVYLLLKL